MDILLSILSGLFVFARTRRTAPGFTLEQRRRLWEFERGLQRVATDIEQEIAICEAFLQEHEPSTGSETSPRIRRSRSLDLE